MSTITELEEKVKELLDEIETLKREKKNEEFEYSFKNGEEYWLLCPDGRGSDYMWDGSDFDKTRYSQGNIFKTKAEAERECDRRLLLTRFRQFRDKCNRDWKPDFEDGNLGKHYISLNHTTNMLRINFSYNLEDFNLFGYFRRESDAARAIQLFGDEIKRLYVEE